VSVILTLPVTPTISRSTPATRIRRPTGLCPFVRRSTKSWLTVTTAGLDAVSVAAIVRPARSGMRSVSKYAGVA
jgi:hypothetical protein